MINHMKYRAASAGGTGTFSEEATMQAAKEIRAAMETPSRIAFVFASPSYADHLEEFCEVLRVDGHISDVMGAMAPGILHDAREAEKGEGFTVTTLSADGFNPIVAGLDGGNPGRAADLGGKTPFTWIAIADPFALPPEPWLQDWGAPVVGGLTSGEDNGCRTFLNGKLYDAVVAGIPAPLRVVPFLSQGCRPIGEPLTVTRAENNVVFSLGSDVAYNALQSAFETLTDDEKATARGNLFAGLAGTEYVEEFRPDDFLVRNILGADPNSGAVAIGGIPRVGQTLQYQLRDATSADTQLQSALKRTHAEWGKPIASIAFACTGRGSGLFGHGHHDASALQNGLGTHPGCGFFCNGEISPLDGRGFVHSYSLAAALIYPAPTE
jgi:small ligand-binding sensory domain FIST